MIKNAKVEANKTPSCVSGIRSSRIENGEALAPGEALPANRLEKVAGLLDHSLDELRKHRPVRD